MAITTGNWGKALWPGINAWYGEAYNEYQPEWPDLFEQSSTTLPFVEDVGTSWFGLAKVKNEGAPTQYDNATQGFVTRYNMVTYSLGFVITRELVEDDQYDIIGRQRARALAFSMRQTKETVGANVYNRAFNSSFTGGDGKELLATDHPNVAGGTFANELSTPADISETSLEQAAIDIMKFKNDRGLRVKVIPRTLIVPPDRVFEAERILNSPQQSGTANNDINALFSMGKFPGGIRVNHYLTDPDAWFIRTNVPDGMKYFTRIEDQFTQDNDFDTDNAKFKARSRFEFGWTDPRGLFGSPGA